MRLVVVTSGRSDELVYGVSEAGWIVDSVLHPLIAEAAAPVLAADAIVVEIPDGLHSLAALKERSGAPILATAPPRSVFQCLRALERGADMYVMRPFALPELVARLEAMTRRAHIDRQVQAWRSYRMSCDTRKEAAWSTEAGNRGSDLQLLVGGLGEEAPLSEGARLVDFPRVR